MLSTAKDWLHHLMDEARNAGLNHLDLLLNGAVLPHGLLAPLMEQVAAPECARLFEHTLEHALAHQGPLLLRIALGNHAQCAEAAQLLNAVHTHFCVLALTSRWPFEALAAHLRGAT